MRVKLFTLFLVALIVSGMIQYRMDNKTDFVEEKNVFVSLPPGKTIKILSFGYHDLAADLLFIWSIQFYSAFHYNNRYDYLEQVYNTITDISPRYKEPYIVGSWIMALEAKDVDMAIRLLEKGAQNMPEDYFFYHECAYYASKELEQYDRAAMYYRKAAMKPGAPHWLKRREAHMVYMKKDLDQAYEMWSDIYANAQTKLEKNSAFKHLYQIKFDKDRARVEKALQLYKKKFGGLPSDLSMLVRHGFLKKVPIDFSGEPYIYKPEDATITAATLFSWK